MHMMMRDTLIRKQLEQYRVAELAERRSRPDATARPAAATIELGGSAELEFLPYGATDLMSPAACPVLSALGPVELEYAAIRRGAAIFDSPHRVVIELAGTERLALLDRLMTAPLGDMAAGDVRSSFLLSRKGRIEADLLHIELSDRSFIEVDVHHAAAVIEAIDKYIIADDVQIIDRSSDLYELGLHGPLASAVLAEVAADSPAAISAGCAHEIVVAGIPVVVARRDQIGEPGFVLIVPTESVTVVWERLVETDRTVGEQRRRVRPIGWYAFNIARVEAGTPLFNIDFSTTNLPHETGLIDSHVSMTKGCYVGQEVVSRTHNLGQPKQRLVGLRMQDDLLPVDGATVYLAAKDGDKEKAIGVVTSSTLSPMLGASPIAFAMIKNVFAKVDSAVIVDAENERANARITALQFWPEPC